MARSFLQLKHRGLGGPRWLALYCGCDGLRSAILVCLAQCRSTGTNASGCDWSRGPQWNGERQEVPNPLCLAEQLDVTWPDEETMEEGSRTARPGVPGLYRLNLAKAALASCTAGRKTDHQSSCGRRLTFLAALRDAIEARYDHRESSLAAPTAGRLNSEPASFPETPDQSQIV